MNKINFHKIEKKWQDKWEKEKIFEVNDKSSKTKYYVLEQFPYPSGSGLHVGHSFIYTMGDIYARFKRMQKFNVLYPIGFDSFGLPAENAAIKSKSHPKKFTEDAIKNFIKQMKIFGYSYDWSRMIETHKPEFYKWDQWIFLKMFEKKLAYKKEASVNWCPKCNTVLANEQVINGKCWIHDETKIIVKKLNQWFLKITLYAEELLDELEKSDWPEFIKTAQRNWIGKSHGAEILFEINGKKWPIFTTRPDTIYGVTFMVISAQHPKLMKIVTKEQKKHVEKFLQKIKSTKQEDIDKLGKEGVFTGTYAINPINNDKIPIYAGNFVIADYGSGMIMAVPAHDERDFEFAKKYNLAIKPVIIKDADESYSFIMGVEEAPLKKLGIKIIEKTNKGFFKIKIPFEKLEEYKEFIRKNMKPDFWNEFSTKNGFYFIFKHKNGKMEEMKLNEKTNNIIDKYGMIFNGEKTKKNPENVYNWLAENDFYKELLIHTNSGKLINSGPFTDLDNEEAK